MSNFAGLSPIIDTALLAPGKGTGLYVHVPFCLRKCLYCDFNSYALALGGTHSYLQALRAEMNLYAACPAVQQAEFVTLFVGGGTPTVLQEEQLVQLLQIARTLFRFHDGEVTVEANPGTVNLSKLAAMRAAGVNRLSLGVQSFNDELLHTLGRVHTSVEALQAFRWARTAGFDNINVDIMFALPGQTFVQLQESIETALDLEPEHISCYSLIVEEGTPFGERHAAGQLALPGEDLEATMYEWVIQRLRDAGYDHYEISNFARPGFQCKHNQIYWRNEWYLGLGPGAHSHWGKRRFANMRQPAPYNEALKYEHFPINEQTDLTLDDQMDETLMMGLRLLAGVSEDRFSARFGCRINDIYGKQIERLQKMQLVEYDGNVLRLSRRGLSVGNQVFAEFIR